MPLCAHFAVSSAALRFNKRKTLFSRVYLEAILRNIRENERYCRPNCNRNGIDPEMAGLMAELTGVLAAGSTGALPGSAGRLTVTRPTTNIDRRTVCLAASLCTVSGTVDDVRWSPTSRVVNDVRRVEKQAGKSTLRSVEEH